MYPTILNPTATSLPTSSLWVVPEHQLWVPCFMHQTCADLLFYIRENTCFNAILSNHLSFAFSQSPKDCSVHLCLFCCLAYRAIITIFLVPYICIHVSSFQFSHSVVSNSLGPHGLTIQSMEHWARILEWVAIPFSRGSSQARDQTQVSHIAEGFFTS